MTRNSQILLLTLIVLLLGGFIFYYSLRSKSPPELTEEQIQALIESTTAPADAAPLSEEESKKIIDSTTAPEPKPEKINN